MHILDLQDLAAAKDEASTKNLLVLVRPDYIVAAIDLATLRKFNSQLERHGREFASTPFAQRVAKEYAGGVTGWRPLTCTKLWTKLRPNSGRAPAFSAAVLPT